MSEPTDNAHAGPAGGVPRAMHGRGCLPHPEYGEVAYLWGASDLHLRHEAEQYLVEASQWRTWRELIELTGIPRKSLHKLMRQPQAPRVEARLSPGGRIMRVRVTPELLDWLRHRGRVVRLDETPPERA